MEERAHPRQRGVAAIAGEAARDAVVRAAGLVRAVRAISAVPDRTNPRRRQAAGYHGLSRAEFLLSTTQRCDLPSQANGMARQVLTLP